MAKKSSVLQFKTTLQDIEPAIWRRIQILDACTFWDLHVAIQNAMGWTDSHLHHFRVINPGNNEEQFIGIPDDNGFDDDNTLPGWEYLVKDYIDHNPNMIYLYDFGDSWYHSIEFENVCDAKNDTKYPICLDGERACPPEDVGSIPGYYDFVKIMKNPKNKEYKSMLEWYGKKYDPEAFDPQSVKFQNPEMRLKQVISGE